MFWQYCLKPIAYFRPLFYSRLSREQQKFILLDTVLFNDALTVAPIKVMWKNGVAAESGV
jgi:hypothetical protein